MNITRENTDSLNAVIKVLIEKNDYEKNVADKLKDYRKKASLPGFRPGFVPASLIQRRFGKAILAEEVNQLDIITDKLNQQLSAELDHQLGLLGSLLEPFLIIFVGILVGIILIGMYLPMFQISTTIY